VTEALVVAGALAFGGLLLWAFSRASEAKGRAEERAEHAKDVGDAVRKANEAAGDVGGLSPDNRRRRLSAWSND
jgi:hypothetical protein